LLPQLRFLRPRGRERLPRANRRALADKEQGNFCDYFRPPPAAHTATDPTQSTRAQLAGLFAKKTDG